MNKQFPLVSLSALLLIILWSCHSTPKQSGIIEMVSVNGKEMPKMNLAGADDSATTIRLSDLFGEFRIIPLETSKVCLIMNTKLGFTSHSMLVCTQAGSDNCRVLEFDLSGKYIREFGRWGKGPGEHTGYWANELTYDPKNQEVFIAFNNDNETQLFGDDGTFRGLITGPTGLFQSYKKFNDSIWMTPGYIAGYPKFIQDSVRLIMFRPDGKIVKIWQRTHYPPRTNSRISTGSWEASVFRFKDQWRIYSPGDDTIYQVTPDRLIPQAILNPGPKRTDYINQEHIDGSKVYTVLTETEQNWYVRKEEIFGTGIRGHIIDNQFLLVIDKKTGAARNLRFEDDFLGILHESESAEMIHWTDNGQPYIVYMALELKESIKTTLKKNDLDLKIRARLEQLDKQVTVDSNPVIVLMKTKDAL